MTDRSMNVRRRDHESSKSLSESFSLGGVSVFVVCFYGALFEYGVISGVHYLSCVLFVWCILFVG